MNKKKFIRKAVDLEDLKAQLKKSQVKPHEYVVEKKIELTQDEWRDLAEDFFGYKDYIAENVDVMINIGHVQHCLLVTTEGQDFGILIQSEGYPYARYSSIAKLSEVENG